MTTIFVDKSNEKYRAPFERWADRSDGESHFKVAAGERSNTASLSLLLHGTAIRMEMTAQEAFDIAAELLAAAQFLGYRTT